MGKVIAVEGITVPIGSHEGKAIVIGSDHRGFTHKSKIVKALKEKGHHIIDVGANSPERCDYPPISDAIGKEISKDPHSRVGIGICGSGIGILIPASKHKCIYTARCNSPDEAQTSRQHNNTNLLGIGADYVDFETALVIINSWLTTPFYSDAEKEQPYLLRYVQTVKLEQAMQ